MPQGMRVFLDNLELWLTGAGLAVIVAVPSAIGTMPASYWHVIAITAVLVGIVHGLLFWLVRRRQRLVRRATLFAARGMLRDVVNNRLQVLLLGLETATPGLDALALRDARAGVEHVSALLGTLSEESLRRWEERYAGFVESTATGD